MEDAHVVLLYEYEHETAVPQDMYGDQYEMVVVASGVRMSIFRSELKSVEV